MLNLDKLKVLLSYDKENGNFIWLRHNGNFLHVGEIAGTLLGKYIKIRIDGVGYSAHRLAWYYSYGEWPSLDIDHINGDTLDNRLCNLRVLTKGENNKTKNKLILQKNNTTGYTGVIKYRTGFRATIRNNGKQHYLGQFKTAEEAYECYLVAKKEYHL